MHVLLADDHDVVREGLRAYLAPLFGDALISEAASCSQVLAFTAQAPIPDLILLDLHMPGMASASATEPDTMEGLRAIVAAFKTTPIVVVSAYSDPTTISSALRNGARGFVPKSAGLPTLLDGVRRVLAGEFFVPQVPTEGVIAPPRPIAANDAPLRRVSARESTVLQLLTRGLTNKEIALRLGLKEITVKVHLQHAYRKIGASNRADAVRIILQAPPAESRLPEPPAERALPVAGLDGGRGMPQ